MKTYIFYATTDYSGDGVTYFDVELDDREAALLEEYATQEDVYFDGFCNCEELSDLYNKVYKIAVDVLTEEFKEMDDFELDEDEDEDEWRADETYAITVHFPESFEP